MQVAQEILRQLGGPGRLGMMINAKNFLAIEGGKGLRFKHMKGESGVNMTDVVLNGADLYDVKHYRVHGLKCDVVVESEDVFVGDLRETFRGNTGLAIQL